MPKRLIAGQAKKPSRSMHDIRYDEVHEEFYISNQFAQAVTVFSGGANGNVSPKRIIQGPKTKMTNSDRVEVDAVHNEIFSPSADAILGFPREANWNVATIRVIRGKDTQLRQATSVVVDPVNNLLIVGLNSGESSQSSGGRPNGAILIFNRTDDGNVMPRAVIKGPKSGITRINQMAVYPPRKLMVAAQPDPVEQMEPEGAFVGIWSKEDNGDVPTRWKINASAKSAMKKPRGVVLDPRHKELIVADMRLNSVLTFYFPEIF
jgi:hypothetical protein